MLIEINNADSINDRKLMDIYQESNIKNADYYYLDAMDKDQTLITIEQNFLGFIKEEFFNGKNRYMIWEHDGHWVSALRLYKIKDRFYYIEALETHPDYRRMGYATELLSNVLNMLKKDGAYTVCDCVRKSNTTSLSTHQKCGFVISSDVGYDFLYEQIDDNSYGMQFTYKGET